MKKLFILGVFVGGISAVLKYLSSENVARDILARTIWAEARGDGWDGMQAVASVIVNRAQKGGWWGNSIIAVCLMPWQFSAWNKNDPNRDKLLTVGAENSVFNDALIIAQRAVDGVLLDTTNGATHYHTSSVSPSWKDPRKQTVQIATHIFYKGIA